MQLDEDVEESKASQTINSFLGRGWAVSEIGKIPHFAFKYNIGFCLRASWSLLHLNQSFPSFVSKGLWIRASLFFFFFFVHVE